MAPAPLTAVETGVPLPERTPRAAWWPRLNTRQWAVLAAAAMLLVATSSALTAFFIGAPTDAAQPSGVAPASGVSLAEDLPLEARYAVEIEQLLWTLYEHRDTLDPGTVSTIETNLRVIDRAIGSAREALEEDPDNAGLVRMLDNNYRHKLQLLQRARRIIEMS
jgi:hypothetical protein